MPQCLKPLIYGNLDPETLQALVRKLYHDLSVGNDGISREFYKYGPLVLLECLRAATEEYIRCELRNLQLWQCMGGSELSVSQRCGK
jgi:hypothetical protein